MCVFLCVCVLGLFILINLHFLVFYLSSAIRLVWLYQLSLICISNNVKHNVIKIFSGFKCKI